MGMNGQRIRKQVHTREREMDADGGRGEDWRSGVCQVREDRQDVKVQKVTLRHRL